MKIKKINIGAYGKLKNVSLDFSDGINIISGSNESGKSTVCSFIKYALYGFSGKASKISSNDKIKYMPWDGTAISGSMLVSSGDRNYRIERQQSARGRCAIFDSDTQEQLDLGKEPGEELLGVDESTFSKTAFIKQTDTTADNMDGISEAVQNIILSADETVNTEKARKKLNELKNTYRNKLRSTGKTYELSQKISDLTADRDEAILRHRELLEAQYLLDEVQAKISLNKEKLEKLYAEIAVIEGYEAKTALDSIEKAKQKVALSGQKLYEARQQASYGGKLLEREVLYEINSTLRECEHKETEIDREEQKYLSCSKERKAAVEENGILSKFAETEVFDDKKLLGRIKRNSFMATAFLVLTGLAAAAAAIVLYAAVLVPLFLVLSIAFFAANSRVCKKYGFKKCSELTSALKKYPEEKKLLEENSLRARLISENIQKLKADLEKLQEQLAGFSALYGDNGRTDDMEALAATLARKLDRVTECVNELEADTRAYSTLLASYDISSLEEVAKAFAGVPERDRKSVERDIKYHEQANIMLAEKEKEYIQKSSVHTSYLRKPAEIEAELEATKAILSDCTLRADGIEFAMTALESACDEVRQGLSPRISQRASELFCEITGGKYKSLSVSPTFELGVYSDSITYSAEYLSTGALDAAYISLRIALAESLYKDRPILVFDETFAYFDDERLGNVRRILDRLSQSYQIFIFTCHDRSHLTPTITM